MSVRAWRRGRGGQSGCGLRGEGRTSVTNGKRPARSVLEHALEQNAAVQALGVKQMWLEAVSWLVLEGSGGVNQHDVRYRIRFYSCIRPRFSPKLFLRNQ